MIKDTYCDYCGTQLTAGREFVYQFESLKFLGDDSLRKLRQDMDEETLLESIRISPDYLGEPLRVCQRCSAEIEANRQAMDEINQNEARQRRGEQIVYAVGAIVAVAMLVFIWIYKLFVN